MVTFSHQGDFNKTEGFLKRIKSRQTFNKLQRYAQEGTTALANATPKDTGLTSKSWSSKVYISSKECSITWSNSNRNKGVPIALVIQYGHGTPTGGYVKGVDYINPALKPIFDRILADIWREVTK